ncbi:hypothetical protein J7I80_20610, partial [Bacillus sp. ISL-41]|uniref:hypothetical protein n=1 Tax=Bacillus sp. ISL-41 TaxID=2819127 RepID=UPI001BECA511
KLPQQSPAIVLDQVEFPSKSSSINFTALNGWGSDPHPFNAVKQFFRIMSDFVVDFFKYLMNDTYYAF